MSMHAPAGAKMSLRWNQMETDGNFETGSISAARYATYSVSDNELTISRSGTASKGIITPDSSWYSGNRYRWFVSLNVYETVSCSVNVELSDRSYANVISTPSVTGGSRIASVIYMNHLTNSWMRIAITSTADGAYAKVGKFWAVNLTTMFGSGKEPTAEEFVKMFPYSYYLKNNGETIQGYKLGMGMFSVQPNHL